MAAQDALVLTSAITLVGDRIGRPHGGDLIRSHTALITGLYDALARRDAEAMAAAYHPDASFSDPVFQLRGDDIGDMWRMLCSSPGEISVEVSEVEAEQDTGSCHWEPRYVFAPTARTVHNVIDSSFRFRDGLIVGQVDTFHFGRWSRQALGLPGQLLGWTPLLRRIVQSQAAAQLAKFQAKNNRSKT